LAPEFAQTKYLAAKQTRIWTPRLGFRLAPGDYWVSTLNLDANAATPGSVGRAGGHPRGQTTRIELTNLNARSRLGSLTRRVHPYGHSLLWIGFNVFILACIALDLGYSTSACTGSACASRVFSLLWVALSILFGLA